MTTPWATIAASFSEAKKGLGTLSPRRKRDPFDLGPTQAEQERRRKQRDEVDVAPSIPKPSAPPLTAPTEPRPQPTPPVQTPGILSPSEIAMLALYEPGPLARPRVSQEDIEAEKARRGGIADVNALKLVGSLGIKGLRSPGLAPTIESGLTTMELLTKYVFDPMGAATYTAVRHPQDMAVLQGAIPFTDEARQIEQENIERFKQQHLAVQMASDPFLLTGVEAVPRLAAKGIQAGVKKIAPAVGRQIGPESVLAASDKARRPLEEALQIARMEREGLEETLQASPIARLTGVFGPRASTFGETLTAKQVLNIRSVIGGGKLVGGTEKDALARVRQLYPTAVTTSGRVRPEYVLDDVVSQLGPRYQGTDGVEVLMRDIEGLAGSRQRIRILAAEEARLGDELIAMPEAPPIVRTDPGMPEAGVQDAMFGVAPREVRPTAPVRQASLEDFQKLQGARGSVSKVPEEVFGIQGALEPPVIPPRGPVRPRRGGGGAARSEPIGELPDISDFSTTVETMTRPDWGRWIADHKGIRSILGVFNPAAVANEPSSQAVVGRAMLRHEGQQLSQAVMARLNAIGTQEQVFGKLTPEGLIAEGALKGTAVNTIRTYPERFRGLTTQSQKQWIDEANLVEQEKLGFLRANGIEINELAFEEGGQYAGRRVVGKLGKDGEFLDAAYVGAGPGRPGAKTASEKARIYKTVEEASSDGYRYLPEDEALFLNVQGAYNRVADKRMAEWFLLQVPWRTSAVPEAKKVAAYAAKEKVKRAVMLKKSVAAAVRGDRIAGSTLRAIGAAYPGQTQALKSLIPRLQGPNPQTASSVQALTVEAERVLTLARQESVAAVGARAAARERAETLKYGETRLMAPAFAGKIFTGPEAKESIRVIEESLNQTAPGFFVKANKANAVLRYFRLAGDASPMMIQLLYLMGANPRAYAGAGQGFVRSVFDTRFQATYLARPENMAIMQKYPELILTRGGLTEMTEAMAKGGLLRRLPMTKALEPFQRGFEGSLDVAGIELAKSLDSLGTTAAARSDIAQFINEFRGVTSSQRIGVSASTRQMETFNLLAPRYNRAIAALMWDTVANGSLRGSLARKALARGVSAVVLTGLAIQYGLTRDEKELVDFINPASPTFMTWKMGGQNVGPGSKIRSVIRLFGRTAADPESLIDIAPGQGYLEYLWQHPAFKFGRAQAAPLITNGLDLLSGKDYIGDPTRDGLVSFTETVGKNFMPIWISSVAFEGGDAVGRATRAGAEFAGGRSYPRNRIIEVRSDWESDTQAYYDIPTDPLERRAKKILLSRAKYREANPEVDAKLFITGQVSSIKGRRAMSLVVQLVEENDINPTGIKAVQKYQEEQNKRKKLGLGPGFGNDTDALIRALLRPKQEPEAPSSTPSAPESESYELSPWLSVSREFDGPMLKGLQGVWKGEPLDEEVEHRLREVYARRPLGAPSFNAWIKQTLRQMQLNNANKGRTPVLQ